MVDRPAWLPVWRGATVVIVASGPSAIETPFLVAQGLARFVAVNNSVDICPWADTLVAADYAWWRQRGGCPDFAGLKVSTAGRAATDAWGVEHLEGLRPGTDSGTAALELVRRTAPAKVLLVGFDATLRYGVHWHGPHPTGLANPRLSSTHIWRRAQDGMAEQFRRDGIAAINCSPISTLERYPKMTFAEALAA